MLYPFKISVVVPSYNRAHLLALTLPSYIQPGVGELIVVDDCSSDNTAETVHKLKERYPQIVYKRNEVNKKQAASKNVGIGLARGEYIYFGDDDSILLPGSLSFLLDTIEYYEADLAGARALYMGNYCELSLSECIRFAQWQEKRCHTDCAHIARLLPFESHFDSWCTEPVQVPYLPACFLVKSETAREILFDEAYVGSAYREETDFCVRSLLSGKKLMYDPRAVQVNLPPRAAHTGGAHSAGKAAWLKSSLEYNRYFFNKNWLALAGLYGVTQTAEEMISMTEGAIYRVANTKTSRIKDLLKKIYYTCFVKTRYSGRQKKIVIVSWEGESNAGGVERVVFYIAGILRDRGYEVCILQKSRLHTPRLDFLFQSVITSLKLFFMKKDAVITNGYQSFLYPADLAVAHGNMRRFTEIVHGYKRFSGAGLVSFLEKESARRAKTVLAVSAHVKDELSELYGIEPAKIRVLENCVDVQCYTPGSQDAAHKVILFSGRLEVNKGLQALSALSDYLEKQEGFELRIAANTEKNASLFASKKRTHLYTGLSAQDMPAFYASGDILFFPSLYEGFSMAVLEALCSGLPVLAGSRFVLTDELKGYPFCRDISEIAANPQAVLSLASELISEWGHRKQEIHERIAHDFGIKQYTSRFMRLMQERVLK